MAISDAHKTLVQHTFGKVVRNSDDLAIVFYQRLFELEPTVQHVFRGDIHEQGRKLMSMISFAVGSLDNLDILMPTIEQLGVHHVDYGVRQDHYRLVKDALLWMLEQGLGREFTPEVKGAWESVYGFLSDTAIQSAYN